MVPYFEKYCEKYINYYLDLVDAKSIFKIRKTFSNYCCKRIRAVASGEGGGGGGKGGRGPPPRAPPPPPPPPPRPPPPGPEEPDKSIKSGDGFVFVPSALAIMPPPPRYKQKKPNYGSDNFSTIDSALFF